MDVKDRNDENLKKYMTFRLMEENYGVDILKVREIIGLMDITPVPRSEYYLKGVINLRGKIIPVVDLRRKLGLEQAESTRETCIITVTLPATTGGEVVVGLLVDAVNEVMEVAPGQIEDLPSIGSRVSTEFVTGVAKVEGKVCILLDIERSIEEEEVREIEEVAQAPSLEGASA